MQKREIKKLIGQILTETGKVSLYHLRQALDVHKFNGKKVGEALLDHGVITREELDEALATQIDFNKSEQVDN